MPPINKYQCNKCDFTLPGGWGGYVYTVNEKGGKEAIPHPGESLVFFEAGKFSFFRKIKPRKRREGIEDSTGFNSHCVCFNCLKQFALDIGDAEEARSSWRYYYGAVKQKDERKCPHCNSRSVKTVFELIGNICPKCKDGIIKEIETGAVS